LISSSSKSFLKIILGVGESLVDVTVLSLPRSADIPQTLKFTEAQNLPFTAMSPTKSGKKNLFWKL